MAVSVRDAGSGADEGGALGWGIWSGRTGAQAVGSPEVVSQGVQQRQAVDLGDRAHLHDAEAAVLEGAVDGLAARATLVDQFAGGICHAGSPGLDRVGLVLPSRGSPADALG